MADTSAHRGHGHGAEVPPSGAHAHASHSTEPHSRAMTSDDAAHGHYAHDAHRADHRGSAHDKNAGHSVEMFRQKFWGTLLLTIPTVIWAPMIQHWFGYDAPGGPVASRWIPAVFGALVFGYGGWVFLSRGAPRVRRRLSP